MWSKCQKPLSKTSEAGVPWEIHQNAGFGVCNESLKLDFVSMLRGTLLIPREEEQGHTKEASS